MPTPKRLPQTQEIVLTSPLGGVVQTNAREEQRVKPDQQGRPATCWDASNVLPYDFYGRARIAQRTGTTFAFPGSIGTTQIQGISALNVISYTQGLISVNFTTTSTTSGSVINNTTFSSVITGGGGTLLPPGTLTTTTTTTPTNINDGSIYWSTFQFNWIDQVSFSFATNSTQGTVAPIQINNQWTATFNQVQLSFPAIDATDATGQNPFIITASLSTDHSVTGKFDFPSATIAPLDRLYPSIIHNTGATVSAVSPNYYIAVGTQIISTDNGGNSTFALLTASSSDIYQVNGSGGYVLQSGFNSLQLAMSNYADSNGTAGIGYGTVFNIGTATGVLGFSNGGLSTPVVELLQTFSVGYYNGGTQTNYFINTASPVVFS